MNELNSIFAANLEKVAKSTGGHGVVALSKFSGIGKTTVYGIIAGDRDNTTLTTVELLSNAVSVPAWQMLIPGGPSCAGEFKRLDDIFSSLSDESRIKLLSYAEDLYLLDKAKSELETGK
jgi:hypothetical protein